MKRHISILITALTVILSLASCDDFLDIRPTGKVLPHTGEEMRDLLTEAYSSVPSDRGMTAFRSDELILDRATTSADELNLYLDIWRWKDGDADEGTSSFSWRTFYYTSYIANFIIEKQNSITKVSESDRRQLVGEAYMLRAYIHFLLTNLYGAPYTHCDPAITKSVPLKLNTDMNAVLSRNTVAEIYTSILEDVGKAKELLNKENWDTGYTYRFNKLSADAFLARIYLYMGNWEKAYEYAMTVMEAHGDLEDMTSSSTLPNHYTSVESILAMELVYPSHYQSAGRVSDALLPLYRSGDMRKSKFYRQLTASVTTVAKGGSNEFRCTFRSAEFYLIAAEAATELNDLKNARLHLTALMKKRYASAKYPEYEALVMGMTKDELCKEIQDERFRELAFEGHRWFDLRRTNRPALTKTYLGETYTLEKDDERYTLRIPTEALEANPNLSE